MIGYERKHICRLFRLLAAPAILLWTTTTFSQDLCTRNLQEAQESFDVGKFIEVDTLLRNCIKSGFTKQERIDALELLALSKLYLDDMEQADSIYLELLTIDPEHTVNALLDPPDLIFLHQSFRTDPVFSWSAFAGLTYAFPAVIHSDFLYPSTAIKYNDQLPLTMNPEKEYKSTTGFIFGFNMDFVIYRGIYAGWGFNYTRTNFKYIARYLRSLYVTSNVEDLYYESTYKQNHDWISVPVFIKYQFDKITLNPYLFGGISYEHMIRSRRKDLSREKVAGEPENRLERGSWDDLGEKNRVNFSLNLGIGFMYKTNGIDYVVVELRYSRFLKNIANNSVRYGGIDDQSNIIFYGAALDDYALTSFDLTLKFLRPFYRPKKIL